MACLGGQIEFSGMFRRGIERDVKLIDQDFLHQARAFMAQQRGRFGRAESGARGEDVRDELFGRFAAAAINDPALCPVRVAVLGVRGAREQRDFAAPFCGVPCGRQASQAAANDEDVGLDASYS